MVSNYGFLLSLFLGTCLLLIALMRLAPYLGLVDQPTARKRHDGAVPVVGGIAMFAGLLIGLLLQPGGAPEYVPYLAGAGLLVAVGTLDDVFDLPWQLRLLVQVLAVAVMVFWEGLYIGTLGALFGGGEIVLGVWGVPFTIIAVVGVINAFNMVDGLDGLAGGLALVPLGLLTVVASLAGHPASDLLALLGCVLGAFLLFNYRFPGRAQARLFMGDAGSMFLGYTICWVMVALSQGPAAAMSPVVGLWLIALPLCDTLAVMLRRLLKGRSPFAADRQHLHHILLLAGFSVQQAVGHMVLTALLLGAAALVAEALGVSQGLLFALLLTLLALYIWATMRAWTLMKQVRKVTEGQRHRPAAGADVGHASPPRGKRGVEKPETVREEVA